MAQTPQHFTRDPTLSAGIADQFGGGAGNAEQLIDANNLRYSEELVKAQMLASDPERTAELKKADVAKVAELNEEHLLSYSVHGDFVVYVFEGPDGRTGKDILLLDGKSLEAPERADSPQRAALRASVESANAVNSAKDEAAKLIEDAHKEAAEIVAKAGQDAQAARVKAAEEAARNADKDAEKADKAQAKQSEAPSK